MLTNSTTPPLIRVQARHLLRGDITGSGETVLSVSVGARTPRGKVEVSLEKGARQRTAFWNGQTIIGVRRDPAPADIPLSDRA